MPLVWADPECLRLACAFAAGKPSGAERSALAADTPERTLRCSETLVLEDAAPSTLHVSQDDWVTTEDMATTQAAFGLWRATVKPKDKGRIVFTRRFGNAWEGSDHVVEVR